MDATVDDQPRMTVAEIALVREIVKWRKTHGWRRSAWQGAWVETATQRAVSSDPAGSEVGIATDRYGLYRWYRVESVAQAVDLLVTFGYLPARFASSYRAGWSAAQQWYNCWERDGAEFRRLFHDPENISFPAGGIA